MKKYTLLLLIALLFSCKGKTEKAAENIPEESGPEVQLYVFDGGTVQVNMLELFAQDTTYKGQAKEFADAFFVVKHPEGTLMWDAGLPESLVPLPEPFTSPDGAFTVSRPDSVVNQLATIGMSPSDFTYIALSHSHFDHIGHANVFKDATWLVQEEEYNFVTSEDVKESNPELYQGISELTTIEKLSGDHDVFGDGTVVIKSMPGHTPGHQVLYLELPETGPVLLSGDLYHFNENREHRRVPVFNYDVEQTLESMEKFEAFAEEKGARVIIQHEKSDFDALPKAPKYLN